MSYSVWWSGRDSLVDAACVSSQVGRWGSVTSHGGLDVGGRHSRTAANGMMCTRRRDDSARPANPRHQRAPAVEVDRRRRRPSACRAAALAESGTRGADVRERGCRWPSQRSTRLLSLGGEPKHAGPWLPSHALEARRWQVDERGAVKATLGRSPASHSRLCVGGQR
jgi:hypothetical protein